MEPSLVNPQSQSFITDLINALNVATPLVLFLISFIIFNFGLIITRTFTKFYLSFVRIFTSLSAILETFVKTNVLKKSNFEFQKKGVYPFGVHDKIYKINESVSLTPDTNINFEETIFFELELLRNINIYGKRFIFYFNDCENISLSAQETFIKLIKDINQKNIVKVIFIFGQNKKTKLKDFYNKIKDLTSDSFVLTTSTKFNIWD